MLAAVILSGGASSRMGSPKALLPYQGRPFLEHLLEIISRPEIGARRVVLGADAESIAKAGVRRRSRRLPRRCDSNPRRFRSGARGSNPAPS